MSFLSTIAHAFLGDLQERSDYPSLNDQLATVLRTRQAAARPWRVSSLDEALGVPAIFRAVSLIASTVGMLSLEAYRLGVKLNQADTPRIVQRPNPHSSQEEFWSLTAYHRAVYGEAWWWIPVRDGDGNAASLYPVNPRELVVTEGRRGPTDPDITWTRWNNRKMRLWSPVQTDGDIVHLPLMRDGGLRGFGPLQKCGAAVSVAVEAQEWAANFFAGSTPSLIGKTEQDLDENDTAALDAQWNEKPPNLPHWLGKGIDVKDFGLDPVKAQLTDTRNFQDGAVAQMFGIPGSLLEHTTPGSSLTYTNNEQEYLDFLKSCLRPLYLNPIEQKFQDLLPRTTSVQFSTDVLLRADIKTRFAVYESAITKSGVLTVEEARAMEGLEPGDIETAPVPYALPGAVPTLLPLEERSLADLRCERCGRLVGRVSGRAEIKCERCGMLVAA